ncbi:MAG: hypothetical protein K2N72_08070 [Oscillospiraceae bacterium]|nr:hypothetical protein [Oscillospiraceae bacterium]
MKKMKKTAAVILSAAMALSAVQATAVTSSAEWVKSKSGYSYKDDATGKKLTGWQTIGGSKYYFDKNGIALTGWKIINGDTYYFNGSKKGKMLTSWAKISGKQYYFGSDGVMRNGWVKINGNTYYFGSDGVMLTGTYKISGKIYTFGEDGVLTATAMDTTFAIDSLMDGLEFGMTKNQVKKNMPYKDSYTFSATGLLMVDIGSDDYVGAYVFDADDELCCYMVMFTKDTDISNAEKLFENAGWIYLGEEDGGSIYASPDYYSIGVAAISNDKAAAMVYSYDILEEIASGNKDALAHLGT